MTAQMKRLDDIHDKEVTELKKKLDGQNREEMKALAKKHKDKSELDRYTKNVTQMVDCSARWESSYSVNAAYIFWFKYDLGQKYYAPQVQPNRGSNS